MVWFIGVNTLTWEIRKPTWLIFALALTQARFVHAGACLAASGGEHMLYRGTVDPMGGTGG